MALIALLLALGLENTFAVLSSQRRYGWFTSYSAWLSYKLLRYRLFKGNLGVLLILIPFVALFIGAQYFLSLPEVGLAWLVTLVISAMILVYTLGPQDMPTLVRQYLAHRSRDDKAGAAKLVATITDASMIQASSVTQPDFKQMDAQVFESILVKANSGLIAVIFWFLVLGPAGAVFYRLSAELALLSRRPDMTALESAAIRLQAILDWIPVRITILGFAIVGSFVDVVRARQNVLSEHLDWISFLQSLLLAAGLGAMQIEPHKLKGLDDKNGERCLVYIAESQALVHRALVMWLTVLALLTLSGWLG